MKRDLTRQDILNYLRTLNKRLPDGIRLVGLFGSYARDEQDRYSDIDITYMMDHNRFYKEDAFKKLIALEEIKKEIETALHRSVDLVPANTKNIRIKQSIMRDEIRL
jgi:predicted nucleotidyltransferase